MKSQIAMRRVNLARLTIAMIGSCIITPGNAAEPSVVVTSPGVVKCGDTIAAAGSYRLAASCQSLTGNAITIQADNVYLDLGGFSISGPGISATQCKKGAAVNDGVVVMSASPTGRVKNFRMEHGHIEGFVNGISFLGTDYSHLASLESMRNCNGLLLQGAYLSGIHDNTISNNLSHGVIMTSSDNNWVHHNYVNSNGVDSVSLIGTSAGGFLLVGSNRNLIGSNDVIGSGNYGMVLTAPNAGDPANLGSNGNEVLKNNINQTKAGPGLRITVGDVNLIADNTISSNSSDGLVIQSGENLVQQNTVNNNLDHGILATGAAAVNDLFRRNTARGNRIDLQDDARTCANTWKQDSFVTDSESGSARGPGVGCIQ